MAEVWCSGRVALVTGSGSGMGRATAAAFAVAGAAVVVADVNDSGSEETVAQISAAGGTAVAVHTDVSVAADVEAMVGLAVSRFGGLDFAINNAAVDLEGTRLLVDLPDDIFQRVIDINLTGVFLCLKHEIRQMRSQGRGGAIVNIASVNAFRSPPTMCAYTSSKHGVVGLTTTAAVEYAAEGIRVNSICPGGIDTPMLESTIVKKNLDRALVQSASLINRLGEPTEIAQAALWLCSPAASFVIGHQLAVDGGMLTR